MNLGISNTQGITWKRIKAQHIILAGAAALAVSALVGGLSLRNDASPSAPRIASPASINQGAPLPQTFVYVVGSQAEAAALELSFNESATLEGGVDAYRTVMVVGSPEAEEGLRIMQGELLQAGTPDSVRIVDLRFDPPLLGRQPAAYTEAVTPEAEMLSTGLNPSGQTVSAGSDEYVELVTPEAEMLSAGMNPLP